MPDAKNSNRATPEKCTGAYERLAEQAIEDAQDDAAGWGFTVGFIAGQAEKVFNGACLAAMFRPTRISRESLKEAVDKVAAQYAMPVYVLEKDDVYECWIYRQNDTDTAALLMRVYAANVNSPEWHQLRARLCGIPPSKLDFRYHERDDRAKADKE